MSTRITLAFGDGDYEFHLGLKQIDEIQTACNAGIGKVYARLLAGTAFLDGEEMPLAHPLYAEFRIEDAVNVVRQGLIGGGKGRVDGQEVAVSALRANQLVENYLLGEDGYLETAWRLAVVVMKARMSGYQPPKPDKKKERAKRTPRAGSTSTPPSSTVR